MATIICLLFIAFAHRVPCNAATPHALPLDLLSRILNEAATDDAAPGPPRTKYGAVPVYEFSDPEAASAVAAHVEREMPFVFRGAPSMASAGARWTPAYLKSLLGRGSQMHWFDGEYFRNSAMLYSVAPLSSTETEAFWEAWGANTTLAEQAARRARAQTLAGAPADVAAHHNSMYLQATAVSAPFIGEDLPLFQSPEKGHRESAALAALLGDLAVTAITIPECRFGLRGIRIEAHFDTYANVIAVVSGFRRIVIAPPSECSLLSVSQAPARLRHSMLDWGDPAVWASDGFARARGASVTLGPGDALYLPPFWFHYIKSLSSTAQCSKMMSRATPPRGALQCLADKSAVVLAPAPPFPKPASSPSPLQRVAQLLTTLLTRKYDAGNRVFEPDATVLLDYLDVDWRTAPWAHLDSSEPFGSYAAALRTSHTAADVGIVLRVWESWLVRPVFGTDALTWFSSRDAAVERVPRGITAALLLELRRHVVDSEPSFACTLDGSSYGGNVRRIGATLRLQLASNSGSDNAPSIVDIDAQFSATCAPHICTGESCNESLEHGESTARGGILALELSLLFRGSPNCGAPRPSSPAVERSDMPGMDRAATTIRFEATPAKEFVLYSWTLRARHSGALDSSGEDSAAAPAGDLSIAVTLFTLPSYRGLFGFARRLSANTIALWETVGGPPWPYLQAVGSVLLQTLAFPALVFVFAMQVCCRCWAASRRMHGHGAEKTD